LSPAFIAHGCELLRNYWFDHNITNLTFWTFFQELNKKYNNKLDYISVSIDLNYSMVDGKLAGIICADGACHLIAI